MAPDNRRIMFNTLSENYGPDSFDMEKYICHIFNTFEILIREDLSPGCHFVFDAKSVKIGHVAKLSPMVVKKASLIMEVIIIVLNLIKYEVNDNFYYFRKFFLIE